MNCPNCGFYYEGTINHCPNCGAMQPVPVSENFNPVTQRVSAALKDSMFLALCILFSASTLFALLCKEIPVINILITIFLWIAYSNAATNKDSSSSIRCISGTVYANYIIQNVAGILLIVAGGIVTFAFSILSDELDKSEALMSEFEDIFTESYPQVLDLTREYMQLFFKIIGPVFIVLGVLVLIFSILGMRKIHRFLKSVHLCMNFRAPFLANPRSAKNWILFYAILCGISTANTTANSFALISNGCMFVSLILATLLVRKYFVETNN